MAEALSPDLMKIIVGLGFQGVVMAVLGWVALRLDKRNQENIAARIAEAKETLTAFNRSTDAIEKHTAAITALTDLVRTMVR